MAALAQQESVEQVCDLPIRQTDQVVGVADRRSFRRTGEADFMAEVDTGVEVAGTAEAVVSVAAGAGGDRRRQQLRGPR